MAFVISDVTAAQLKAIELTAVMDPPMSPQSLGISKDARTLGGGIHDVEVADTPRVTISR